ncbi:hypothetical protein, partial [Actinotalea lenta]
ATGERLVCTSEYPQDLAHAWEVLRAGE